MSPEHTLRTGALIKTFHLRGSLSAQHLLILKADSTVFLTAVMKGNMLIFAPFCLLLCCMLPADAMTIRFDFTLRDTNQDIPLSMVEDSVDDMYFGCDDAMMETVKNKYIEEETNKGPFLVAWKEAKVCVDEKFEQRKDKALTKDHMHAICVYTGDHLYTDFNTAVRTKRNIYGSSFQFRSLHYLLTSAIKILNNNYCHTTYRRVRASFTGEKHQIIRFGSFASSSYKTDLTEFGNETCFKIKTCSGASLKNYSAYDDREAEVLIPPYEMFNITEISNGQGKFQDLKDCERVFVLESAGVESRLNCKVVHNG
ncbi:T-cell ecto-ADP-ribosyltransferase 1-like [Sebastes umbrosus]|uniref:T-cell ecto-ADP-ribosyltransferase 1-like n=1 Tax=Sebastes umbrosus TaxID=72105 RepID=UPI00189F1884|nr:T-cell ecto-ADP-ribosyltransferase 1-like [Sebastes umbrosus]